MATLGTPTATAAVINKHNFSFRKKFGQNFLVDMNMLEKIISSAEVTKEDCVLEIGPGIGTMTQYLAERAGKVVVVEIDSDLIHAFLILLVLYSLFLYIALPFPPQACPVWDFPLQEIPLQGRRR